MERRQSTRIPFTAPAFVVQDERSYASQVCDISKEGLFVATGSDSKPGDLTSVSIVLEHAGRELALTVPCAVTRVTGRGFGCRSEHLDPETLLFFSNLLHDPALGPGQFVHSFYSYLDGQQPGVADATDR